MRNVFLAFGVLFALNVAAQNRDESSIRIVLANQNAAWNRGDIKGFMQGYWDNDSLIFIGKSGVTYGWQPTLDNYVKTYPSKEAMGKLQFTIIKVQKINPDFYNVIGKWQLKRGQGDLQGHFTLLFKRIAGNWKIVQDHSS